ncbi:MAG: hypothetical protein KKB03_03065 [Nanoarchaeota archaeon]|nr:hypothetical protein [Nanoarchaeota archaeon]MBU1135388.1 hypothetical protein [Nanoarchaeota archaeon]MBU2520195.1 hypothetical protein [Nanoarchaeota archaeon]
MGKVEIVDDCLSPARYINLSYSGPNPYEVSKKIASTLQPFFHISGSGTGETLFNWDNSGDPHTFFFKWWVKKTFSGFTTMWFHIKTKGSVSPETNDGEFIMSIQAIIKTTFSGYSLLFRPLWYIYSLMFYNKRRRQYLEMCNNFALSFRNEMKEHFNLDIGIERPER